jgi:glutamate synthase (NADPH) large chain
MESHGLVDVMSNMGAQDAERLVELIKRHMHYTGSERAKTILENWDEYLPKFRRVMPVEYKRALAEMAKQQAADTTGLGVLEIGLPLKAGKGNGAGARK